MRPTKKALDAEEPFLKAAATAIGTALGRLAVKTGMATPLVKPAKTSVVKKKLASKRSTMKKGSRNGQNEDDLHYSANRRERADSSPSHSGCCAVESKTEVVLNNSNLPSAATCADLAL